MSIQGFRKLIERTGVTTKVFPLALPNQAPDEVIVITTGAGAGARGDLQELILTVTSRAKHPETAEAIGTDLRERLNNLTNEYVGASQVVFIKAQERLPQFLGKDSNDFYYFETNYTVLVND